MLGSRVSPSKRMVCGALALALGGCDGGGGLGGGVLQPTHGIGGTAVQGRVEANATGLGTFEAVVSGCASGARQHFFGVDVFSSERDTEVRVVVDPMGRAELRVRRSEQPQLGLMLNSSNCARLDVGLNHGIWSVDRIQAVHGTASFDCQLASGGQVKGEFTFSGCV